MNDSTRGDAVATQPRSAANPRPATQAELEAIADPFRRLAGIMARLRGPEGCPWDQKQTHETLKQYVVEETYELVDAVEAGDDKKIVEELGDVILQVVFHAQLGAEAGRFTIDDVCESICEKLFRRHPHVFGEKKADDAGAALRTWESMKAAERAKEAGAKAGADGAASAAPPERSKHIFSGVPAHLPALLKASRVQEKAACVGFDWPTLGPVLDKVREELNEWEAEMRGEDLAGLPNPHLPKSAKVLEDSAEDPAKIPATPPKSLDPRVGEEFGDLLFALVNASRFLGLNAEEQLQAANKKFMDRFLLMSRLAADDGRELAAMNLAQMDEYWEKAKRAMKAAKA
jgi:MazG family protein